MAFHLSGDDGHSTSNYLKIHQEVLLTTKTSQLKQKPKFE